MPGLPDRESSSPRALLRFERAIFDAYREADVLPVDPTECEILFGTLLERSDKEIARQLGLSGEEVQKRREKAQQALVDIVRSTMRDDPDARLPHIGGLMEACVVFTAAIEGIEAGELLPIDQLVGRTGYSPVQLDFLLRNGEVEGVQVRSKWYGSTEAVERYQQRQTQGPGAPRGPRPKSRR